MAMPRNRRVLLSFALCALLAFAAVPRPGQAGEGDEGEGAAAPAAKDKTPREGAQKFEFQAEVNRLMDIIINSLYSNKDIFLRELISNASDALDKLRFLSLTDPEQLGEGDDAKLEIKISLDTERKVLMLRDRGIGMTKQDLINNLGTIAKSGTSSFLEQMQKGGDMNLIGQFGVGFYSVYLVADYIEVISKHNDDVQYIWESKADGNFAISEDTESEPLGRGTQINIYLKDEAQEYANEDKLRALVEKYSEFINFPIYMYASKEVQEEVEIEDDDEGEADEEGEAEGEGDEEGEDYEDEEGDVEDEEEEEDAVKTKTITKTVHEWELLNDSSAIWLRSPSEVEDEDYEKFYKSIAKDDYGKPLSWTHFKAEGDVEFRSVMFIPETAPPGMYDNYWSSAASLKLYVRRVFISDEFEDLVPRYLSFLRGLVDSDTLPLNVSREMLQQHSSLKTIKKKLVRKALDMIRKLAAAEEQADEEDGEGEGEADAEAAGKYKKFWKEFGKSIKLGIMEDTANRQRLAKLLRVQTSRSGDEFISLDKYVEGMKEGQKSIYYIAGQSLGEVKSSPFLEKLLKKGYEVIYFTDALDEYMMQQLTEYDDLKFQNASKENLKMSDKDSKERKREKELKEEYKPLTKWWKEVLGSGVEAVKVSNRLTSTPCVVVTGQYGWSANMERIVMSQALGDAERQAYMKGRRSLEINPNHPMISTLKARMEDDPDEDSTKDMAQLMYETALLESGFQVAEPQAFADMVHRVLKSQMGLDPNAEAEEEEDETEEEEEEAQEEEETLDLKEREEEEALDLEEEQEVKDEL